MIMEKVNLFFPEKTLRLCEDDKPWMTCGLKNLDRQRKREYSKNKKSIKWRALEEKFKEKSAEAKPAYYTNMVEDLLTSNPGQWYSKIKRMSNIDPTKDDKVFVQELMGLPSSVQAEIIADQFAAISKEYEPLKADDINIPNMADSKPAPLFEPYQIYEKIKKMKKKASTVICDIPWRVILEYAVELSAPLSNIFNTATLDGIWPDIWKREYVTPAPKVYPTLATDDLRKIAGTKNLSKIYEALLSEFIIDDMKPSMDPSQYGNVKGLSIQHYLVKMVDKILTILDTNNKEEKYAVIAQMVDWSKAFDRQDPKLGIQNFIQNGVRATIIPVPSGGPQGSTFGLLEYKVNSRSTR